MYAILKPKYGMYMKKATYQVPDLKVGFFCLRDKEKTDWEWIKTRLKTPSLRLLNKQKIFKKFGAR